MKNAQIALMLMIVILLTGCAPSPAPTTALPQTIVATVEPTAQSIADPAPLRADVTTVKVTGEPGSYVFSVTIASPDTGCDQYADWWEVVSEDGALLYRRILAHSHVGEQPFTRSGGPVAIDPETAVWVRAHMFPGGYGGAVMHGSVSAGFEPASPPAGFGAELETVSPQPDGCAF